MQPTLNPKLDVVFKLLFADERNRRCLTSLLTAVINPAQPIVSIEVLNPETPRETIIDKGAVLDLRLRLSNATQVHVEVQLSSHPGLRERLLFYWARVYSTGLARGGAYTDLKPSIGIFIFDFKELESERYHSIFRLLEVHDHSAMSDALELHILELPKLPPGGARAAEEPVLRWARFLAAESDQEREQLAMTDPDLQHAKSALEQLSDDPMAQRLAFERQIELNSRARYLELAREQAAAEGLAEGRATGHAEGLRQGLEAGIEQGIEQGLEQGLEQGIEQGLEQGIEQGEAKGRNALAGVIELLCQQAHLELTADRRAQLNGASLDELRDIASTLARGKAWPET